MSESIDWKAVTGVQPVVYVARADGQALAILEKNPTTGFRLTTCSGKLVGEFPTLEEGQSALAHWLERHSVRRA